MQKITNLGGMTGIAKHNTRSDREMKSVQHTDPSKPPQIILGTGDYRKEYEESLKAHTINGKSPRVQKNCCYGWDVVTTLTDSATLGDVDGKNKWLQKTYDWMGKTFGYNNVRTAIVHNDEKSFHCHWFITPFHLNEKRDRYVSGASHWTDGTAKMRTLQNSYYDEVSQHFGLARGTIGSKTKHVQPEAYRKSKEKKRKSFIEWFNNKSPSERTDWILKAFDKLDELDTNTNTFKYYQSKLEEVQKNFPDLTYGLGEIFKTFDIQNGGAKKMLFDIQQPFELEMKARPGKLDWKVNNIQPTVLQTAFSIGAIMGAMFATGADKQPSNNMSLIDFYMKVLHLDFSDAEELAKGNEEVKKKVLNKSNDLELV